MFEKGWLYKEYFSGLTEPYQIFTFLLFGGIALFSASYSAYLVVPEHKSVRDSEGTNRDQ